MISTVLGVGLTILVWVLVIGLFVSGLVLTVINMPGIFLIFAGIFISAFYDGFNAISPLAILIFGIVSILVTLIDNLVIPYSTKLTGGSNWAIAGAILGAIIGLFIGGIGVLFMPFFGALLFEYAFTEKDFRNSAKSGVGAFIGFLLTVALKIGASLSMIVMWFILMF